MRVLWFYFSAPGLGQYGSIICSNSVDINFFAWLSNILGISFRDFHEPELLRVQRHCILYGYFNCFNGMTQTCQ